MPCALPDRERKLPAAGPPEAAGGAISGSAHSEQNSAPAGFSVPHWGHFTFLFLYNDCQSGLLRRAGSADLSFRHEEAVTTLAALIDAIDELFFSGEEEEIMPGDVQLHDGFLDAGVVGFDLGQDVVEVIERLGPRRERIGVHARRRAGLETRILS